MFGTLLRERDIANACTVPRSSKLSRRHNMIPDISLKTPNVTGVYLFTGIDIDLE